MPAAHNLGRQATEKIGNDVILIRLFKKLKRHRVGRGDWVSGLEL